VTGQTDRNTVGMTTLRQMVPFMTSMHTQLRPNKQSYSQDYFRWGRAGEGLFIASILNNALPKQPINRYYSSYVYR